ncbi:hypothetical protein BDZ97DRAFT_1839967 [Flammula alnicola]|nr:hypothetical protein BDZ97DRAFT_1839967 [Flammula alnicola]
MSTSTKSHISNPSKKDIKIARRELSCLDTYREVKRCTRCTAMWYCSKEGRLAST